MGLLKMAFWSLLWFLVGAAIVLLAVLLTLADAW